MLRNRFQKVTDEKHHKIILVRSDRKRQQATDFVWNCLNKAVQLNLPSN
jgi:hypothetical protein